jgi:hypothetical protein
MTLLIKLCHGVVLLAAIAQDATAQPSADRAPIPAQFAAIAAWVSSNSDLPHSDALPEIKFVSQLQLERLRYGRVLTGALQTTAGERPAQAIGGEHSTPHPQFSRRVAAVYDDATETIYLPENWEGKSRADQSVLVHEMAHHLQNRARLTYACPGAREKPAYLLQKRWLDNHGLDFAEELQVDMFTIVAMSACME